MECITIYTDASIEMATGCAGWGAWVKYSASESFKLSGALKEKTKGTTAAELMAIANALSITIQRLKPTDKYFVIVTDSQAAKQAIERGSAKRKDLTILIQYINKIIPSDCKLKINKVKAHTRDDGRRSYINNLVDNLAKDSMRLLRQENNNEKEYKTNTSIN